jgi:hypothetical protein
LRVVTIALNDYKRFKCLVIGIAPILVWTGPAFSFDKGTYELSGAKRPGLLDAFANIT